VSGQLHSSAVLLTAKYSPVNFV